MYIVIDLDTTKDMGIIKSDSLDNIREAFSEADPKASLKKHLFKSRARFIPSRMYAISEAGRFNMGLLPDIIIYLKKLNTPFRIIFTEQFKARYICVYPFAELPLVKLSLDLYEFQSIGVKKALKNGCGLLVEPTGAGKTLMQATIIQTVRQNLSETKVLLITPTHLINQIYNEFISYGINSNDITKWSGENNLNMASKIIICGPNILYDKIENVALEIKKIKVVYLTMKKMLETDHSITPTDRTGLQEKMIIANNDIEKLKIKLIENEKIHEFLGNIGLLIVDEIHQWKKSGEITNVLKHINTRNRFGFTGTLPEMKIDQWNIIGNFGPIVHESKREDLVADKHITDTDVRILVLEHKAPPDFHPPKQNYDDPSQEKIAATEYYEKELDYIQHDAFRNNVIRKISEKTTKNTLILIDRLEHGKILNDYLQSTLTNKKVYYIIGEVEDEERQKIQDIMEKENNIVCIAMSRIFSTGISIKNLHHIIFTTAGKAKIKTIQSVGRGVRKLEGKDSVTIWDICDNLYYSEKHLIQRTKIYDNDKISYKITKIKEN